MKIQRAYKIKLYPNKQQERQLLQIMGATRFVYNYFLSARKGYYDEFGKTLSYRDINAAKNILKEAQTYWVRGATVRPSRQVALKRRHQLQGDTG